MKSILLFFWAANLSITLWLKSCIFLSNCFSMDSIARALRRSCVIVFLIKVLIRFNVEKHLSAFEVDIEIVTMILRSFIEPVRVHWESPSNNMQGKQSNAIFTSHPVSHLCFLYQSLLKVRRYVRALSFTSWFRVRFG